MYVAHLSLHDFRSYPSAEVALEPGVTAFLGRNGQGKTNLVEAVDYLSRLASHRVATDAPLVRAGAERAVVRAAVVRDGRQAVLEVEVNPGRANRARVNKSVLPRAREMVGLVRTVLFSPEDLALVKGDPAERRRLLDDLLVLRSPRLAGTRADYDRVLRQRNSLLKTAGNARGPAREAALDTLGVWDDQLVRHGADLLGARLALVDALRPYVAAAYHTVAQGAARDDARLDYRASVPLPAADGRIPRAPGETGAWQALQHPSGDSFPGRPGNPAEPDTPPGTPPDTPPSPPSPPDPPAPGPPAHSRGALAEALQGELQRRRTEELDRGVSLVGPHRDDLLCALGDLPVRGYASHGESWSFALALRLASYDLLRADGDDPILILDDVFAELDAERRDALAALVSGAEQVLVTAAVGQDVPPVLAGARFRVAGGEVVRDG